jgi:archaellum component FlaF (FlaF/FlaG flagellin family)
LKNSLLLLVSFCFLYQPLTYAQKFTGEWYGVGSVSKAGSHNKYLSELIIKQNGNKISGEFSYYFRSVISRTKITGIYNSSTREILLNAHPLLNYKAQTQNGADCPMEGSFTLRISGADTTLQGQFNPIYSYRYTCPAINVRLVKQRPNEDISLADLIPIELEEEEELKPPTEIKEAVTVTAKAPEKEIVEKLEKRSFESSNVIDVDADSLKVTLYDNGEVDNDTISLFYNRKLVTFKKLLSSKPLTFTLPLDTAINEISMYAENLGSIPPNTALCIVNAGGQRFEMSLSSTYIKNAAIRFRKKPKL